MPILALGIHKWPIRIPPYSINVRKLLLFPPEMGLLGILLVLKDKIAAVAMGFHIPNLTLPISTLDHSNLFSTLTLASL